jgi:hypothetical protein
MEKDLKFTTAGEIAEMLITGGIWKPNSVDIEPETVLTQWQVFEVENPDGSGWDTHFMGWAGYEGRVCSAVQTYDPVSRRGVTKSGRVYELKGNSGINGDALYVWNRWLKAYSNPEHRNVSEHYE